MHHIVVSTFTYIKFLQVSDKEGTFLSFLNKGEYEEKLRKIKWIFQSDKARK